MKSLKIHYLFGIWMLMATSACSQDDSPKPDSVVYESCCGIEPVEYTQGDAYVYVPNVFTPNGDGINDLFFPVINDKVIEVADFVIYTGDAEDTDTLLFNRQVIVYSNLENYAWNGLRYDGTPFEGRPYIGPFKYSLLAVLVSGETLLIEGKACRIECGPGAEVFESKEGCFYPEQVSPTTGQLDGGLPIHESGCFN